MPLPIGTETKLLEQILQLVIEADISLRDPKNIVEFLALHITPVEFCELDADPAAMRDKVKSIITEAVTTTVCKAVYITVLRKALELAAFSAANRMSHPLAAVDAKQSILDIENLFI